MTAPRKTAAEIVSELRAALKRCHSLLETASWVTHANRDLWSNEVLRLDAALAPKPAPLHGHGVTCCHELTGVCTCATPAPRTCPQGGLTNAERAKLQIDGAAPLPTAASEREQFEAWARNPSDGCWWDEMFFRRTGNVYYEVTLESAWSAWQARSSRAGAGVTEAEMSAAIQRAFTDDGMFLALKVDSADAAEIAARAARGRR